MPTLEVRLDPMDPLLFGDNRSARAGEDHVLWDQDPSPLTVYGAIGARIAEMLGASGERNWGDKATQVLGSFVRDLGGCKQGQAELLGYVLHDFHGNLWFPRPLHFRVERSGPSLRSLKPLQLAPKEAPRLSSLQFERHLVTPEDEARRQPKEVEDELMVSQWLLKDILAASWHPGDKVEPDLKFVSDCVRPEYRAGLTVSNKTFTAVEHRLFTRPYRRFRTEVVRTDRHVAWSSCGYTAWFAVQSTDGTQRTPWNGTGFFGGDRRRVRFSFQEESKERPLQEVLDQVLTNVEGSTGFVAYLLTPAILEAGIKPGTWPAIDSYRPVAAVLSNPLFRSGWQAASKQQGPRSLQTLVSPGSAFFYEWNPNITTEERQDFLKKHWLDPVSPSYGCWGFGRMLLGVWS